MNNTPRKLLHFINSFNRMLQNIICGLIFYRKKFIQSTTGKFMIINNLLIQIICRNVVNIRLIIRQTDTVHPEIKHIIFSFYNSSCSGDSSFSDSSSSASSSSLSIC